MLDAERCAGSKPWVPAWLSSGRHHHIPPLTQTNHFFNVGYGWLCKHCSAEDAERKHRQPNAPRQNEVLPFAFWDARRQILSCRRCGIEEFIRNP